MVGSRGWFLSSLLVLASLSHACSPAATPDGPPETPVWSVNPVPVLSVGEVEGDPDYLFDRILDAAFLPDGRIVVADNGAGSIKVFDQDGTIQATIGRPGEGPGEFSYLSSFSIFPSDTLAAYDSRQLRLTKFSITGELLSTVSIMASEGYPELFLGRFSTGEFGFSWIKQYELDPNVLLSDTMQFGTYLPDGTPATTLGSTTGMKRMGSPLPFSTHLYAAVVGEELFLSNGSDPSIQVWDKTGTPVRTLSMPVDPIEPGDAWAVLEAELEARADSRWSRLLSTVPRDEPIPYLSVMRADSEGRLWAKRYTPLTDSHWLAVFDRGEGGDWFVLDTEGGIIAKATMPAGVFFLDASGGHLLGRARDSLGVERIQIFRISDQRGPAP